jgi:hypothetical protein
MPFLDVQEPENDGGYAVENYRETNPKLGTMEDFENLAKNLHQNGMNVIMDFVLNHCADTHQWAIKAKNGDEKYKEYFYFFKDRTLPDEFEKTMLEIFPDTAPGNFTWLEEQQEFVMTLFHQYQWDLNYKNPRVLVEMIDTMLFLANKGDHLAGGLHLGRSRLCRLGRQYGGFILQRQHDAVAEIQLQIDRQVTPHGITDQMVTRPGILQSGIRSQLVQYLDFAKVAIHQG